MRNYVKSLLDKLVNFFQHLISSGLIVHGLVDHPEATSDDASRIIRHLHWALVLVLGHLTGHLHQTLVSVGLQQLNAPVLKKWMRIKSIYPFYFLHSRIPTKIKTKSQYWIWSSEKNINKNFWSKDLIYRPPLKFSASIKIFIYII